MAKSEWQKKANKQWGKEAVRIQGDGQYAVVAPCRDLSVTLWHTLKEAQQAKERIDKGGCGGVCTPRRHQVVNLGE